MLKLELIRAVAKVSGESAATVRKVLEAAERVTRESLADGLPVMLFGLGKLVVAQRGTKLARNPRTGEAVTVPPHKVVVLKPSTGLADAVNA